MPSINISCIIFITICVEEVGVFLIFVDLCINCFEEILMRAFIFFEKSLSWIHYRFMCMVHEILHDMYDIMEDRLFWIIHVATETHGKLFKTTTSFNSDMHDDTNPVI